MSKSLMINKSYRNTHTVTGYICLEILKSDPYAYLARFRGPTETCMEHFITLLLYFSHLI